MSCKTLPCGSEFSSEGESRVLLPRGLTYEYSKSLHGIADDVPSQGCDLDWDFLGFHHQLAQDNPGYVISPHRRRRCGIQLLQEGCSVQTPS